MPGPIALVTDSSSQLPLELARRYDVDVVPITVVVDDESHREGVDLDADSFWDLYRPGVTQVTTSQPSPGELLETYHVAAAAGADEVMSVHVGSGYSGTVNSARLAAAQAPIPVTVVDTGQASMAVGCSVWAAGQALAAGADLVGAEAEARRVAAEVENVFIVGGLELMEMRGRAHVVGEPASAVPVLSLRGADLVVTAEVDDVEAAADAMAADIVGSGRGLRVAVGVADQTAGPVGHALAKLLADDPRVDEIVRYRVGPSVGSRTGPGTAGAVWWTSSGAGSAAVTPRARRRAGPGGT